MLNKTFATKRFSGRKGLRSHVLARKGSRSRGCSLNHQQPGWKQKTNMSKVMGLTGLFDTTSSRKKDVRGLKEFSLVVDEGGGNGAAGKVRGSGAQSLRKKHSLPLDWLWVTVRKARA